MLNLFHVFHTVSHLGPALEMEAIEPEAKRRRLEAKEEKLSTGKKQSTLFAFARCPATPQSADEQLKVANLRAEWIPKIGQEWCDALLPVLRTDVVKAAQIPKLRP